MSEHPYDHESLPEPVVPAGLEAARTAYSTAPEVINTNEKPLPPYLYSVEQPYEQKYPLANQKELPNPQKNAYILQRWRRKRFLLTIVGLAVLVAVIIAVAVGVTKAHKKSDNKSLVSGNGSTSSSPNVQTPQKQIAAGSSLGSTTGANQVFYQDQAGDIIQNLWSGPDPATSSSQISKPIPSITTKNSTPIAAVGLDNGQNTYLFTLSPQNTLQEHRFSGNQWTVGPLSSKKLEAHPSSQLAAFQFNQTQICVFYQFSNGTLQILNYDTSDPETEDSWSRLSPEQKLPAAANGSAIAAIWNQPSYVRLYFQDAESQLHEWCMGGLGNNWVECPSFKNFARMKGQNNTPISAVSWNNNGAQTTRVFFQPQDLPNTVSSISWINDTSWSQLEPVLPLGSISETAQFAAAEQILTEAEIGNVVTLFYENEEGGVSMLNSTEAGTDWSNAVKLTIG